MKQRCYPSWQLDVSRKWSVRRTRRALACLRPINLDGTRLTPPAE